MEQATLGTTIVVKGELTGAQALYVDGRVEGSVRFPGHRVTIGRGAVVLANIEAKEVVMMGTVTGNIECSERVDIRADAVFTGDVATQRISIDEGALVKGKVEIRKMEKGVVTPALEKPVAPVEAEAAPKTATATETAAPAKAETESKPAATASSAEAAERAKAAAAASFGQERMRVAGSKVLFVEQKERQ
jgi:cytoskeletal protein CcmA (bactofilin family)